MKSYKEHVRAKCTREKCNLVTVPEWLTPCPAKDYGFRLGAMDNSEFSNPHPSHCCKFHGCKYGYDDCPVYLGEEEQKYMCEICDSHSQRFCSKTDIANFKRIERILKDFLKSVFNKDIRTAKVTYEKSFIVCVWDGGFLGKICHSITYKELDNWARERWLDYEYDDNSEDT